jgi:hypothetical protein
MHAMHVVVYTCHGVCMCMYVKYMRVHIHAMNAEKCHGCAYIHRMDVCVCIHAMHVHVYTCNMHVHIYAKTHAHALNLNFLSFSVF